MKLTKESKEVNFVIKSQPWSEKDLTDFRILIQEIKIKNKRRKTIAIAKSSKPLKTSKSL